MDYDIIYDGRTHLGEGIFWDDREEAYYFVDIMRKQLHRLKNGTDCVLQTFSDYVGFAAPTEDRRFAVGCGRDLLLFDPETHTQELLCSVDAEYGLNRFNDGKAAPDGRLIAGTMNNLLNEDDFAPNSETGGLFSIRAGEAPLRLQANQKVPNGLAFAADGRTLFHAETFSQTIKAYEYMPETGTLRFMRDVIRIPEQYGSPDGMTISDDDFIFSALWGGGGVAVIDTRTGKLEDILRLPVIHVTCCAFGGPLLDTLAVTTSSIESPADKYPHAGKIFTLHVGKKGRKVDRFKVKG